MTAPVRDPQDHIPAPFERFQQSADWPCGCEVENERGQIRPCHAHEEMNLSDAQLWTLLEQTFPDLELPEPDPRDFDPEC